MNRLLAGFFMCWGNFCYIPGPKKWDENARSYMLGWLPTIGFFIGLIWAGIYYGLLVMKVPFMMVCVIALWLPFVLSGYIHVDGYMDVNDALMSRGTLEKKREILKDSRCGTFAIVSFIFLLFIEFGALSSAISYGIDFVNLILITVLSRTVSGVEVLNSRKLMETSQYKEMSEEAAGSRKANILMAVQLVVYLALAAVFCRYYYATAFVIIATVLGTFIPIELAKKQLQGMNGDIAGYGILWGEMIGIVALIFC